MTAAEIVFKTTTAVAEPTHHLRRITRLNMGVLPSLCRSKFHHQQGQGRSGSWPPPTTTAFYTAVALTRTHHDSATQGLVDAPPIFPSGSRSASSNRTSFKLGSPDTVDSSPFPSAAAAAVPMSIAPPGTSPPSLRARIIAHGFVHLQQRKRLVTLRASCRRSTG